MQFEVDCDSTLFAVCCSKLWKISHWNIWSFLLNCVSSCYIFATPCTRFAFVEMDHWLSTVCSWYLICDTSRKQHRFSWTLIQSFCDLFRPSLIASVSSPRFLQLLSVIAVVNCGILVFLFSPVMLIPWSQSTLLNLLSSTSACHEGVISIVTVRVLWADKSSPRLNRTNSRCVWRDNNWN